MNYALKYKAVDSKPPTAEPRGKRYHIRHSRIKRFSRMEETLVDSLFEQCSSYCESVDKQAWGTSKSP